MPLPPPFSGPKFDHLVVVMMENRSFDHMLGMLYTKDDPPPRGQTFNGVDGKPLFNPGPNGKKIRVAATDSFYGVQGYPKHDFADVESQLFAGKPPPKASMQGFVDNYQPENLSASKEVMSYFPTADAAGVTYGLRLLPALARNFAVSDAWFASVPTETLPNRSFCNAGTSNGFVANSEDWLKNDNLTIFKALDGSREVKKSRIWPWRIYHDLLDVEDSPHSHPSPEPAESLTVYIHWPQLKQYRLDKRYRRSVHRFEIDAAKSNLPAYSFIEPRITGYYAEGPHEPPHQPNDQHPKQDVRYGENLINRIYSAIANSPLRNKTLLVITYDEHGGLYDHVSPPYQHVPAPDRRKSPDFDFTRLGVRLPAVIVSSFIPAGTVYHLPKPRYIDHTAIIKTLVNRWNLKARFAIGSPFGRRVDFAPDLAELLTLRRPRPRSDFPQISPWEVPPDFRSPDELPASDLQRDFVQLVARAHGLPSPPPPRTHADVIAFLRSVPRKNPA